MANQYKDVLANLSHYPRSIKLISVSFLLSCVFLLSACGGGIAQMSLVSTSAGLDTQAAHTVAATTYPVKVFFPHVPQSLNTLGAVFPVDRTSPTIGVGTFAIQLLIAGPTTTERSAGYYSDFNSILTGPSTCASPAPVGGPDFTLTLNEKGNVTETGTATLRFCRTVASNGIGEDAEVTAEINATLKQFASIKKVVILTRDGRCFGDESGLNHCLQ